MIKKLMKKIIYTDIVKKYKKYYNSYFKKDIELRLANLEKPKIMSELISRMRVIYEFRKISGNLTSEEIELQNKITRMTVKKENISNAFFMLIITIIISIAVPAIQASSDLKTQQLGIGLEKLMFGEALLLFLVYSFRKLYENKNSELISFYSLCLDILRKVKKSEF